MWVAKEPASNVLAGSPGQVVVEDGVTRIIPSDSSVADTNLSTYTGDAARREITFRNFDTTAVVYFFKKKTNAALGLAQTPPTYDGNVWYPLGPGEERTEYITANVGLWIHNPTGSDMTIAYDEKP